jgi:predicted dehydrogenase
MTKNDDLSRRQFLKNTMAISAGALTIPSLIPGSALGKNGAVAPSNRVVLGCIGVGGMGTGNMRSFLELEDVQVVAVCDVDANHLQNAKSIVDEHHKNRDCKMYHDFRDLIARNDIDAISLATPDHWHAVPAIAAAESGKDIYGEKPLSHSLAEGRAMCEAVKRHNRIWQTGSWQRSVANFRFACELVRNGRIGKVHTVHVGLPDGHSVQGSEADLIVQDPPKELDYDFWLGPSPYAPYFPAKTHWNWRWQLDFGGGQLLDWVGHHVDIAHWGLGMDYEGPIEIEGYGEYPKDGPWDSATKYRVTTKYKNGIKMVIAGGYEDIRMGSKWIGRDGWVWVKRGEIDANPKSLLEEKFGPDDFRLYKSTNHHRNFIDCVKNRKESITPCEIAHRSQSPGHLGQISMLLGRKIRFNPDTEEILKDPTATQMLSTPMRSPWHV